MPEEAEQMGAELNPKDYWIIQTSSVEGMFIVQKLLKDHMPKPNPATHDLVIVEYEDHNVTPHDVQDPAYWMRKAKLSIEAVSRATGLSLEQLAEDKVITIKLRERPDLPKPTVQGWGEA